MKNGSIDDPSIPPGPDATHDALAAFNEIAILLAHFSELADDVPAMIRIAHRVIPIAALVIVETKDKAPLCTGWFSPGVKTCEIEASLKCAQEHFAYFITPHCRVESGENTVLVLAELYGVGDRPLVLPPAVTIPLVVGQQTCFGILHVETWAPATKLSLVFINAFANQLAMAMDRRTMLALQDKLLRQEESAKNLAARLQRLKEEADDASTAKSLFLANMSHEIRTPLGALVGFAELLASDELSDREREAYVEKIRNNGTQLVSLVNDILDFSKAEANKIEIELKPVALVPLIDDVVSTLKQAAASEGVTIQVKCKPGTPRVVLSDPLRLRQVLLNLVSNAVKFSENGIVAIRVGTRTVGETPQVVFTIADNGLGISAEAAQRLFKPFMQADNTTTRKYGGTGLGLALAKKLANAMGGDVELSRSKPGKGSIFRFFIGYLAPRDALDETKQLSCQRHHQAERVVSLKNELVGCRILLADDTVDNRILFSKILSLHGAIVDNAINGVDAMRLALEKNYDLVLMDLQMPIKDGFTAVTELRAQGYDAPIIALSAYARKEERDRALLAGCDDHIAKPINAKLLIKTVANLIHSH